MLEAAKNSTPLMRQYFDIKSLHPDKILLFRMGDFYEMFFEDAVKAAPIVGIALTSRNKKSQDETPMCGVPHHSISGPINKLLAAGLRVAICDQMEDPKFAKGIVKRAVTRILSPGMVYDPETLDATQNHYIAAWEENVLAYVDSSTGEASYFTGVDAKEFRRLLELLPIVELVIDPSYEAPAELIMSGKLLSPHEIPAANSAQLPRAAQRLLSYLSSAEQGSAPKNVLEFSKKSILGRMDLTATTARHLEIFVNSNNNPEGSLFQVVNRCRTSVGARLLRSQLSFPLVDQSEIEKRLDQVQKWVLNPGLTKRIREILGSVGDIERRLARIAQPQGGGRDLKSLAESTLSSLQALQIAEINQDLFANLQQISHLILTSIVEDPPISTKQGHLINRGVDPQLDELIVLSTDSQSLLEQMENREKLATGISSLKIRYNSVFGYYIEVTNSHKDKVPSHYLRKQTLTNAERYCTEELLDLERKVLSAQSRRFELEQQIFEDIRKQVLDQVTKFLGLAQVVAQLDVALSSAWLALEKNYVRPSFTDGDVQLKNCRHPVVEHVLKGNFIPNSVSLKKAEALLITGPNMAGKSTLMRQVALIAVMAQAGLFVPAEQASLPLFDHLFTRIGASDQLAQGLSTFMVEMSETSEMIKKASAKSLLILDEVGRGTSTYDGLSLAQSILEYILTRIGAITLFATHYHELTSLTENFAQLKNAHMRVMEKGSDVEFLHVLTPGPAQKSYGIYVAKIAGLPTQILHRAQHLLAEHEKQKQAPAKKQLSLLEFAQNDPRKDQVLDELKRLAINNMTPLQAMTKLSELQAQID